jgi:catechol 2,3-dioxygenase-like lactoylglutathione lyase family enzyme
MFARFDHLTLAVGALDLAVSDYTNLLGRGPRWRGRHVSLGTESAIFGLQNALIELTAPIGESLESEGLRQLLATRGEGAIALALGTSDAQACHTQLRARGLRAAPPAEDEATADGGPARVYRAVELSPRMTRGLQLLAVERSDTESLRDAASFAPSMAHALDHVVIRSSALAAARALYGEQLGLRCALDTRISGVGMLFFRVGGVTVEVVEDAACGDTDSFYGAAYRVEDLDACRSRLSAAGHTLSEVRDGRKPGTRVFTLRSGHHGMPTLYLSDPARAPR